MLYEVCFNGLFDGVPDFSVCVRANSRLEAEERGVNKACKLRHYDGFMLDRAYGIGGFYRFIEHGYDFPYGSNTHRVRIYRFHRVPRG